MIRRSLLLRCAVAVVIVPIALTGCGYTWVKKSELNKPPTVIVDSAEVMSLRQQLVVLEAKAKADSVRLATSPKPQAAPDSLIKARDAEIASLKDQLAKATAELDRIKKRLGTPRQAPE